MEKTRKSTSQRWAGDDFFDDPSELNKSKKFGITTDPFADDKEFIKAMRGKID